MVTHGSEVFSAVLHQLEQRFHGAQRAEAGVGGDSTPLASTVSL
jgi:hypothetical protein